MIVAKKMLIIQNNGIRQEYTHVEYIKTGNQMLQVKGESDGPLGMRQVSVDKYFIKDIQYTMIEWYTPKV